GCASSGGDRQCDVEASQGVVVWVNGGEHAKQRSNIISGAIFSAAKDRKKLMIFGNSVRRHRECASLHSPSSREWLSICQKSTSEFAVTVRITNFAASRQLIAMSCVWQSTRCFIATIYRLWFQLTKQSS